MQTLVYHAAVPFRAAVTDPVAIQVVGVTGFGEAAAMKAWPHLGTTSLFRSLHQFQDRVDRQ